MLEKLTSKLFKRAVLLAGTAALVTACGSSSPPATSTGQASLVNLKQVISPSELTDDGSRLVAITQPRVPGSSDIGVSSFDTTSSAEAILANAVPQVIGTHTIVNGSAYFDIEYRNPNHELEIVNVNGNPSDPTVPPAPLATFSFPGGNYVSIGRTRDRFGWLAHHATNPGNDTLDLYTNGSPTPQRLASADVLEFIGPNLKKSLVIADDTLVSYINDDGSLASVASITPGSTSFTTDDSVAFVGSGTPITFVNGRKPNLVSSTAPVGSITSVYTSFDLDHAAVITSQAGGEKLTHIASGHPDTTVFDQNSHPGFRALSVTFGDNVGIITGTDTNTSQPQVHSFDYASNSMQLLNQGQSSFPQKAPGSKALFLAGRSQFSGEVWYFDGSSLTKNTALTSKMKVTPSRDGTYTFLTPVTGTGPIYNFDVNSNTLTPLLGAGTDVSQAAYASSDRTVFYTTSSTSSSLRELRAWDTTTGVFHKNLASGAGLNIRLISHDGSTAIVEKILNPPNEKGVYAVKIDLSATTNQNNAATGPTFLGLRN